MDYNKILVAIKHPNSKAEARWSSYASNQQLAGPSLVSCPIIFLLF
jgi:hypothetical protein